MEAVSGGVRKEEEGQRRGKETVERLSHSASRRPSYRRRPLRPSLNGENEGMREKQLDVKLPIRKGRKGRKEREDFKWGSHNICFSSPLDLIVFSRNRGRAWMVCEVAFCNPPHHELHVCRRAAPRRRP